MALNTNALQNVFARYFSSWLEKRHPSGRDDFQDGVATLSEAISNGFLFTKSISADLPSTGFHGDMVNADLYGHHGRVLFVLMYDFMSSRPVLHNFEHATKRLISAAPEAQLKPVLWAYEDRNRVADSLVYFFRLIDEDGTRQSIGVLPRRLVDDFLKVDDIFSQPLALSK